MEESEALMDVYRVEDTETGEFLGLYRARNSRDALECACREFGRWPYEETLEVRLIWSDSCNIALGRSTLRVRGKV